MAFILWNAENLVGLQAQSPLRVGEAVAQGEFGVGGAVGSVHRLQEEVPEAEQLEIGRI
jgi:hypothetical protein